MNSVTLTKAQARRFLLAHQGLWPPYALEGKRGVLHYLQRVGCIQFDPLNIVGHNTELVLQARISAFQPQLLQDLLYVDRKLLDGYDKMMSIFRVEDWPYFHRRRAAAKQRYGQRFAAAAPVLAQIRAAIAERGPLSSLDLTYDQKVDWAWGPTRLARAALESMYFWGELVLHHKIHTRKVYDFATRHIPADLLSAPDPNETEVQYQEWHVRRRIGSVGLLWQTASSVWHGILGTKSKERRASILRLLRQGKIQEVHVEGIPAPLYMRHEDTPRLTQVLGADPLDPRAAVLAPLDNLLWDRRLVATLFAFDYRWEVYTPVAERRYGYYVLPVLYGDRFVARFEPGRDKADGAFIIKQWWWEPRVTLSERLRIALSRCFQRFLAYLNAPTLRIEEAAAHHAGLAWLPSAVNET